MHNYGIFPFVAKDANGRNIYNCTWQKKNENQNENRLKHWPVSVHNFILYLHIAHYKVHYNFLISLFISKLSENSFNYFFISLDGFLIPHDEL